jgi:hypothetical protein
LSTTQTIDYINQLLNVRITPLHHQTHSDNSRTTTTTRGIETLDAVGGALVAMILPWLCALVMRFEGLML